jgi:hypothetical protein
MHRMGHAKVHEGDLAEASCTYEGEPRLAVRPARIRISVEGRRLPGSDQSMTYGILRRINGDYACVLTISDNYAAIEKWGRYKLLREAHSQVPMAGEARQVNLELWVNGQKVGETTDTNNPLPTGGVGLVVTTYQTTRASVAEFDNFFVEQIA